MTLHDVHKDGTNVDFIPSDGDVVAGAWASFVIPSEMMNMYYYNSSTADNDEVNFPFRLGRGTYNISIVYRKFSDRGKLDVLLDNNIIINQLDMYDAVGISNVIHRESAVVIRHPTKTISLTANGKNAASSNYHVNCSLISFRRVA